MRTFRSLATLLLALPVLAFAQDASRPKLPEPTGLVLLSALPARADLVVHTPDLPALLASAAEGGLGSPKAWRAAFRAQMQAWGERSGIPQSLVQGAEGMLDAADGEVLLAGLPMPAIGGPARATIFAFRTSYTQKRLKKSLGAIVEGGLRTVYPGVPHAEEIHGRPVLALPGIDDTLYISVQDGLVVASDHPLAMGLLFRGLESTDGPEPAGNKLLEVRYGRGDATWTGWTYGGRESVSWRSASKAPLAVPIPNGVEPIVAVAVERPRDVPLLPVPPPSWVSGLPAHAGTPVQVCLPARGGLGVCGALPQGVSPPAGIAGDGTIVAGGAWSTVRGVAGDAFILGQDAGKRVRRVAGGAQRLGWLKAWASGRLELPLLHVDRTLLKGVLDTTVHENTDFIAWTATEQAGELRGPRWHGPATFLALRTIHGIATKTAPGAAVARRAVRVPLPPSTDGGADLPKPVKPREDSEDEK